MRVVGADYRGGDRCRFAVWAPQRDRVAVRLAEGDRELPLQRGAEGYWETEADGIPPGTRYWIVLDGHLQRPDPASRFQPEGVGGPSAVTDGNAYRWRATHWRSPPLNRWVIYELHAGTFSPEGTFAAIVPQLAALKDLGITAIELLPVAQFPGDRNWGYDGAFPFAVQNSYGGPDALKALVDACHETGLAVVLDVVYNHFGPEGNYTRDFGPYFTERYNTPWGAAINYDDAHSGPVRAFVLQNVLYWFDEFRIDALRLDAVHAIFDFGAKHLLQELAEVTADRVAADGRPRYLIAESDLNDARLPRSPLLGGYGLDAQWCDDFHHALHALLTGERGGYYRDFGRVAQLAKSYRESFVFTGDYSPFRQRRHGNVARDLPPGQFVVSAQNHDQTGNRMLGERLSQLVDFEGLKLAAAAMLLSPSIPLLWMGEEYGETAPFLYFIDHQDPDLVEAVRQGRKREFADFFAVGEPPDPAAEETLARSRLDWTRRDREPHRTLLAFYRELLALRREHPALQSRHRDGTDARAVEADRWLWLRRQGGDAVLVAGLNFSDRPVSATPDAIGDWLAPGGDWTRRLDSAGDRWRGPGSTSPARWTGDAPLTAAPWSAVLYECAWG